ncbi:MAG: hypothetical protein MH252_09760 [Thermosynechococcaceae cyanobacterium MS004]|nr:hypothetical protein [Thermosynechococcaceae cyanobacterium MS004]
MTSARSFVPTRQGNPCLICGDTKGKCRQTAEALNLCMEVSGTLPGFKYLGQTKNGLWAKYLLDDGTDRTQEEREQHFHEQQQLRASRAAAEAQRHADALPAHERDRLYAQLLNQLSLHPADRADLHRRGITDEQIKALGIRSVEQWQPLAQELSHALPGLGLDGRSLITPRPGYLCPIRDVDGLIVGFQIRARASGGRRYYWLTGKTKKRPNGPTPHLSNGELPLVVHRPVLIQREAIALVEGTGAKPFILAQKLGLVTIGAAGGQFAASPETLKLTLERLGIKDIEFYPDAGAVQNQSVLRQYRSAFKLLKTWGYSVQIAWWGQEDKRVHPDIDELDDLGQIQLLSLAEFEAIAAKYSRLLHKLKAALSKFARPLSPPQGFGESNEQQKAQKANPKAEEQLEGVNEISTRSVSTRRARRRTRAKTERIIRRATRQHYRSRLRLENYRGRARRTHRRYSIPGGSSTQNSNGDNGSCFSPTPLILEYKPGDRLQTWKDAAASYRYILDISPPGTGKSYDSGRVTPDDFDVQQVIYLSDQHRNPTVDTLGRDNGWLDLEARHGGLKRAATTSGSRLQRSSPGDIPSVAPNCSRMGVLNTLRDKNVSGADTANLICGTCILREACINADGPGYGYLNQRRNTLGAPLLRAHPDSLPNPDDFSFDETLLIWDEPGHNFKVKQSIQVTYADLQQTIAALMPYPEPFSTVQPLLTALLPLLDGSLKLGRYGMDFTEFKGRLPDVAQVDVAAISQLLMPHLGFLNATSDYGVDLADLPKELRKRFTEQDSQVASQAREQVIKQWLAPMLRILQGALGCVQANRFGLTLTLPTFRHRTLAQSASANVFLDGTLSREDLALKLGCAPHEIQVVRQAIPTTTNLDIIQVSDIGRAGMSRGGDQIKRTGAIVQHFQAQDETTRVMDYKKYEADGAWWRDSRGVNDFLEVKTLILIGAPCRNLNDLAAEFAVVTGGYPSVDDSAFTAFVNRAVLAEIHQAIGRLRAHRRTDESLKVVLLSNIEMDIPVVQLQAKDLTIDAAHKTERVQIVIEQAILELRREGKKITQQLVSALTSIPRGTIARYWRLFISLIDSFDSKMNNFENASTADQESNQAISGVLNQLADLPMEELLPSLNEVFFDWLKPHQWAEVWEGVNASAQMAILQGLALVVPEKMLAGAGR